MLVRHTGDFLANERPPLGLRACGTVLSHSSGAGLVCVCVFFFSLHATCMPEGLPSAV